MQSINYSTLAILISLIVCIFCIKHFRWINGENNIVIGSDGLGYYAYLPAFFIQNNLDQQQDDYRYTKKINQKNVNKYFVGTSVLLSPFFGVAHLYSKNTIYTADGYSKPYQFMVMLAALSYLFLGLICLNKLLAQYKISDSIRGIILMAILFGTNLLYYSIIACSMSHVYSFAMICCFALAVKKLMVAQDIKILYLATVLLGLVVLVRPTNGIVLLLPLVLANGKADLFNAFKFLKRNWVHLLLCFAVLLMILSIQPLLWYLQSGELFIWSYSDEGFYFSSPHFFEVLFSYRKGWFVYTPIALLALLGLAPMYSKNRFMAISLFVLLLLIIYLVSSWWNWYYGDSYGLRAFIDYYLLIALPLAYLLQSIKNKTVKRLSLSILIGCVLLNLIQSYQCYAGIMHHNNMSKEKYWHIFLKTSDDFKNALGGNLDAQPYSKHPKILIHATKNDFENERQNWNNGIVSRLNPCQNNPIQSNYSEYFSNEFGLKHTLTVDSTFLNSRQIYVESKLQYLVPQHGSANQALYVIDIRNKENDLLYYYTFKLLDTPNSDVCEWKTSTYSFVLPKMQNVGDKIFIYVWNQKQQHFIIDDFSLDFYKIK